MTSPEARNEVGSAPDSGAGREGLRAALAERRCDFHCGPCRAELRVIQDRRLDLERNVLMRAGDPGIVNGVESSVETDAAGSALTPRSESAEEGDTAARGAGASVTPTVDGDATLRASSLRFHALSVTDVSSAALGAGSTDEVRLREALRDVLHERYGELMAVCDGFHTKHGDDWDGYWTKEAVAIIEAVGWTRAALTDKPSPEEPHG